MEQDDNFIDNEVMEEMKGLMKDKFSLMINQYFESIDKYLLAIEAGIAENDALEISNAAHPLKSSSASLGCIGLSEIAKEMEHTALEFVDNGGDTQSLLELYDRIKLASEHVKDVLREELVPA